MSWAVIRFRSTGRTHRGKMRKTTGRTIMSVHFNGTRAKDGHKCKLSRRGEFNSMRSISLLNNDGGTN